MDDNIPLFDVFLLIQSDSLVIWGCASYAIGKGHHGAWGGLGILSIIGLIFLAFLPDKNKKAELKLNNENDKKEGLKTGRIVGLIIIITIVGVFVWLSQAPEGGVKLGNNIDEYAIQYISDHNLIMQDEELIAYYDVTISLDGSESAIITNRRVIYHIDGRTTYIGLENIKSIDHRYESMTGDIILVEEKTGKFMEIKIAPLNQGETFLKVLRSNWERITAE